MFLYLRKRGGLRLLFDAAARASGFGGGIGIRFPTTRRRQHHCPHERSRTSLDFGDHANLVSSRNFRDSLEVNDPAEPFKAILLPHQISEGANRCRTRHGRLLWIELRASIMTSAGQDARER